MIFTPFSLTDITVNLPVSAMRNRWAKNAQDIGMREVLPRLYNLVTLSAFQAIDLIANLFLIIIKSPVAFLNRINAIDLRKKPHLSFIAIKAHLIKTARNLAGLFGSIIGLVDPKFSHKFLCPISETNWKWAKNSLPLYNKWYDRAFYINLGFETTRLEALLPHLQACKIENLERIPGVYGKDTEQLFNALVELELVDSNARDKEAAIKPFWGKAANEKDSDKKKRAKLGCYLSHMLALKKITDTNTKRGLILEDDVRFSIQASSILESAYSLLPSDWDIIYLGHNVYGQDQSEKINEEINRPTNACDRHAYIVTNKAAKKLFAIKLKHLKDAKDGQCRLRNGDRVMTDLQKNINPTTQTTYDERQFNIYSIKRKPAGVANFPSAIEGVRRLQEMGI